MPSSRKWNRRDGSAVRFGPSPGRIDSASAAQHAEPSPATTVARPATRQSSDEDTVIWLVNHVRARAGLPRLRYDDRLRVAARKHSRDMARRDFCEHVNPDGVTPAQRMSKAGYPNPGGENVARGQSGPHAVMNAWMASPSHRANILNPDFVTIGVGVDLSAGGPYWTQNFGC
ncbi:MAG: hypothetical protein QOF58_1054 [Pseudonocardiales bacterium]|nr:hypothetical protein [Pseudonocardiales bacterium]